MRTDVDHLPAVKQRELEHIVEIILDEFGQATENATGRRKGARILKIILFGSYARGDWVDAPTSANQYKSDYDILVIVSQKELTDRAAYWTKAEERLIRAYTIDKRSEEHTSELQSLMRISYAVFCLKKKKQRTQPKKNSTHKQSDGRENVHSEETTADRSPSTTESITSQRAQKHTTRKWTKETAADCVTIEITYDRQVTIPNQ